ncbi:hypothetical protein ABT294_22550 [Nonomuraea sp. NPDC000554]|uniref:hypothetical protein n=1 Tax=Nonomuraea sp. NPDC000554 TaxID=3154259 RepID=UPI003329F1FA
MFRAVRLITAAVILVAGCAPGGGPGGAMNPSADKPTITKAQALTRIEQLINGTVSVIHPKPQLDLYQPSLNDGLCLDPQDGGSEDRIEVSREYYLRGLPKTEDALKEVIAEVKAYWQKQGHYIAVEHENGLQLYGRSRPDDFLITIGREADNVLSLGATSTCLWPNGTPEPSSTP